MSETTPTPEVPQSETATEQQQQQQAAPAVTKRATKSKAKKISRVMVTDDHVEMATTEQPDAEGAAPEQQTPKPKAKRVRTKKAAAVTTTEDTNQKEGDATTTPPANAAEQTPPAAAEEQQPPKRKRKLSEIEANVPYYDTDGTYIPKRKVKISKVWEVYAVRHLAPIDISEQKMHIAVEFSAQAAARQGCRLALKEDGKLTGRRDMYVRERGRPGVRTSAFTVRRFRVADKTVAFVKDRADAVFRHNSKANAKRVPRVSLREFHQQIMARLNYTQEEIDAVPILPDMPIIDKKTGQIVPDSDSEPEEDIPVKAEPSSNAVQEEENEVNNDDTAVAA